MAHGYHGMGSGAPGGGMMAPQQPQLYQARIRVPPSLIRWARTQGVAVLQEKLRSRLADAVSLEVENLGQNHCEFCVTATSKPAAHTAGAVVSLCLTNQQDLARVAEMREAAERDLEAARTEMAAGMRCEFTVPDRVLGLTIGKKGANLARAESIPGVERVHIDKDKKVVRIRGTDPLAVTQAREMLEFDFYETDLTRREGTFLIGKRGETIRRLERDSEVMHIKVTFPEDNDRKRGGGNEMAHVEITGTKTQVASARALVEMQLEHLGELDREEEERMKVQRQKEQLDRDYGDRYGDMYRHRVHAVPPAGGGGRGGDSRRGRDGGDSRRGGRDGGDSRRGGRGGGDSRRGGRDGGDSRRGGRDGGDSRRGGRDGGDSRRGGRDGGDSRRGGRDGGDSRRGGRDAGAKAAKTAQARNGQGRQDRGTRSQPKEPKQQQQQQQQQQGGRGGGDQKRQPSGKQQQQQRGAPADAAGGRKGGRRGRASRDNTKHTEQAPAATIASKVESKPGDKPMDQRAGRRRRGRRSAAKAAE